jgi:antibiotic biosynthesis monooxygenase (ABM) superfamily enzyme
MTTATTPTRFSTPRFAFLVLLGAYPLITAILYLVIPVTGGWAIWQRTLLVAPMMVAAMVWGVIPIVHRRFRAFVNPPVLAARSAV